MATHQHDDRSAEVLDPVCGMTISPADAVGTLQHVGHTHHFCSDACLQKFRENPTAFVGEKPRASASPANADAEYTCPMHPEIRQMGPGSCPICGMALEPVHVTLEEQPNEELIDMTRRFWWSLALTSPLLGFMIAEFLPGHLLHRLPSGWLNWIELILATPVVLWGGWPFFQRGWASVVTRHLNMFTLIALGVGAAFSYSVVATLAPDLFPASFRIGDQVAVNFEPAAVIIVLVLLGQVLELRARSQTSNAIRNLLGLAPKTARRVSATGEEDVVQMRIGPGQLGRARDPKRGGQILFLLEGAFGLEFDDVSPEGAKFELGRWIPKVGRGEPKGGFRACQRNPSAQVERVAFTPKQQIGEWDRLVGSHDGRRLEPGRCRYALVSL